MITQLNHSINSSSLDYDAREFLKVTKITNPTKVRAINELCKDLKREGFWDRMFRAYPFVYNGLEDGQPLSMLYDLKTRSTLEYYASTVTSITFSETGVKFDNTSIVYPSGYAPWYPYSDKDITPGHISIYSRTPTNLPYSTQEHGVIGAFNFTGPSIIYGPTMIGGSLWGLNQAGNNRVEQFFTYSGNNSGLVLYSNVNDQSGLTASTTYPWQFYMSKNGQVLGTQSSTRNRMIIGLTPALGCLNYIATPNSVGNQSIQEICWWSFGMGNYDKYDYLGNFEGNYGRQIDLNRQDVFYQIVQKFQTSLGRQI